jgi:membrane protease YdiL (CAAX protease family)
VIRRRMRLPSESSASRASSRRNHVANEQAGPEGSMWVMLAVAFEFSLGAVAVLLGWWFDVDPFHDLAWRDPNALAAEIGWGLAAVIPLGLVLQWARRSAWPFWRSLRRLLQEQLMPHFAEATPFELAWVALAAGVGEELLFRGCVQEVVRSQVDAAVLGGWLPLLLTSLLFGLAHSVSWAYLWLATIMGLYLGWLLILSGSLWVPITVHAVYDFIALWCLQQDACQKKEAT